jgi:SEL1 protein
LFQKRAVFTEKVSVQTRSLIVIGASGTGAQEPDSGILGSVSKEDVVQFYQHNADRGDLQAQAVLGQVYYFGTHNIQQNYDKALYYFRKCTASLSASKPQSRGSEFKVTSGSNGKKKDDPENSSSYQCAVFLGLMYIRGDGVKASNQTAFQYFKRAAEGGSGAALYYLGVMHLKGIVVKKNYDSATKLLIRSAEKGFADAYTQLGMMMYEKGEFDAAFKYFQTASKTTNLIALGMLGKFYERGLGGGAAKKSCFVALTYYKNVAERGDYLRPFLSEAFDLYQKESGTLNLDLSSALENEESMAASLLAPIGLFSNDGVKSQSVWMKRAFAKFLIAAEMGYEQAQANIAWIVEKKGFKVYNEEYSQYFASLWWNRAALQGIFSRFKTQV